MGARRASRDEDDHDASSPVDPEKDLLSSIYFVPDGWWGFQAVGREAHPGACVRYSAGCGRATLLKGTDLGSARLRDKQVVVQPSGTNGLKKATTFAIRPWLFAGRKVALLHFDRLIGRLSPDDLSHMQSELERVFA